MKTNEAVFRSPKWLRNFISEVQIRLQCRPAWPAGRHLETTGTGTDLGLPSSLAGWRPASMDGRASCRQQGIWPVVSPCDPGFGFGSDAGVGT